MPSEPHLRAVGDDATRVLPAEAVPEPARRGPRWIPIALGAALVVSLLLLAWSRVELGQRITALQDEVRVLEGAVSERDRLIDAQRDRLGEVRLRVHELQTLVDGPLPVLER